MIISAVEHCPMSHMHPCEGEEHGNGGVNLSKTQGYVQKTILKENAQSCIAYASMGKVCLEIFVKATRKLRK